MTMAMAAPLQTALYDRLVVLPALGGRVFDDAPHQSADVGGAYVTLGDETVAPWDTATDKGAIHAVRVRVYSPVRGFLPAKALAADVVAALDDAPLTLSRGKVITQEFTGAETRREELGALRRIDLTFRIVIEDDAN